MTNNKLSADPTALILGIIALVIGFAGCCCYGIFAIIPLILGIIGLVMANKSLKEFAVNPEAYSPQSRSNVATAKILNIIAIIFNSIVVMFFIAAVVFYGTISSQAIYDEMMRQNGDDFHYEWEDDKTYDYNDDTYDEVESDTMSIDSIRIDEEGEIIEVETSKDSINN